MKLRKYLRVLSVIVFSMRVGLGKLNHPYIRMLSINYSFHSMSVKLEFQKNETFTKQQVEEKIVDVIWQSQKQHSFGKAVLPPLLMFVGFIGLLLTVLPYNKPVNSSQQAG